MTAADLHCHILPGLDDGPADLHGSLVQAAQHVTSGVELVVATPHVREDLPGIDAPRIAAATQALNEELAAHDAHLRLVPGAEVDLRWATRLDDAALGALTLGGSPWLLVEAPLSAGKQDADVLFGMLRARGHRIVIAHPERSPQFHRHPELLRTLVAGGAVAQVTALALTGGFGSTARRYAGWMLDEQLAHVVASDAHDTRARPPGLVRPLEEAGYGDLAPWLTEHGPEAILAGAAEVPVPPRPARGGRKRGLGRLRRR
ncbi:MAG TPA: CpsB/CapC family capsule biosynthesis tyrosine phosphatase [Baekduia sp.]